MLNVGLHGRREEMWACFMQGRRLKARSYRAIRRWTTRGRKVEASRPKLGVEWKTGPVGMWLGLGLKPTNKTTTKKQKIIIIYKKTNTKIQIINETQLN